MRPASIISRSSAGGVIYRRTPSAGVEVALISAAESPRSWGLPKGIINKGEKTSEAALREVFEETGIKGEILEEIGSTSYWYFSKKDNSKCRKTVTYFLMRHIGGEIIKSNEEIGEARWQPIDEAIRIIAHESDRTILLKAASMIAGQGDGDGKHIK